ncbi:DUF4244 domain-containing protein [Rathayibacter rathayi]|uniref:DUF4244 domain-containing protein n=1 Tax=Rathayibacter rathayi TaxID=33887 RepID=UPI000BD1AF8B|nr:DUF4244 domain-containing protein [Rathayibacter rathayi]TWD69403.1 uncharacterized protein DUF4244 [Rathayibacter rathayi]SOE02133.1 Protein of unknown function [Rathayibacter rathayi NCPPB 2980 = VKM Ac-1601]
MSSKTAISSGGVARSGRFSRSPGAGSGWARTSLSPAGGRSVASSAGVGGDFSRGGGDQWRGRGRRGLGVLSEEEGSATAEYAIATMAAVGFAGLLVVILKGDEVRNILTDLVTRALTAAG